MLSKPSNSGVMAGETGFSMADNKYIPASVNDLPSLKGEPLIAIDCETRDPNLMTLGPGGARGDGYVVGVSFATANHEYYLPTHHEGGGNLEMDSVVRWLRDNLAGPEPKVGANVIYDLEWLRATGIQVGGRCYDVQVAEPLLDENKLSYRLEVLARQYCGIGKDESKLTEMCMSKLGIKEREVKANLWRLHAEDVAQYGAMDARLTYDIFMQQEPRIDKEGLREVFEMETELTQVLLAMRFQGVRVNLDKADRVRKEMYAAQEKAQEQLDQIASGNRVDVWSGESIEATCKALGITYGRTEKGNPSFEGEWLENHEHLAMQLISRIRKLDRSGGIFIEKKILEVQHGGRIFPTFRQVRSDDGGTRTGRFASANPNMQQIPARDPIVSGLIRGIFVPDPGRSWGVFDYNQQEPRVTVHYAALCDYRGASEAVDRYVREPETDYHGMVAEMAGISRKDAKTLNLGLAYGMGKAKMAVQLGMTMRECMEIYDKYHSSVPYMKQLGDHCMRLAQERGYIKTLLGRKRRFNLYGPVKWSAGMQPLPKEDALREFGPPVVPYFCHKAMNSLIQGSSADMIKKAMLDLFKEGIVPHITIHDELDISVDGPEQAKKVSEIMSNCVQLKVPLKVDCELGPSWGEVVEVKL
jgi:DNA polymerase I-like protein with 3'-5' exonuclease and polymerase domains